MPLTQELGDAAGFTGIHTNRMIRSLRQSGLISVTRGLLKILNAPELFRLALWKPRDLESWAYDRQA